MNYLKVVDKQLKSLAFPLPYNRPAIIFSNIVMPIVLKTIKAPKGVKESKITFSGYNGMKTTADVYEPENHEGNLPCILYIHGGAFCYTSAAIPKKHCLRYAKDLGCKIIYVQYHLAPKHRYPAGYEDCVLCYEWILKNHESLGIDPTRICFGGESGGGVYSAMLANEYEKRGLQKPAGLFMTYPVLDAAMSTESMKQFVYSPIWGSKNNDRMWNKYYTKGKVDLSKISPTHSELPSDIVKTYIETAEFDCLRDEGIAYAKRLQDAGGEVVLNETKGTFHGYDTMDKADVSIRAYEMKVEFLKECFGIE